ncbi:Uncharacterized protein TCM_005804 isoform 2, partial [Theobroma cacao]
AFTFAAWNYVKKEVLTPPQSEARVDGAVASLRRGQSWVSPSCGLDPATQATHTPACQFLNPHALVKRVGICCWLVILYSIDVVTLSAISP